MAGNQVGVAGERSTYHTARDQFTRTLPYIACSNLNDCNSNDRLYLKQILYLHTETSVNARCQQAGWCNSFNVRLFAQSSVAV